MYVACPARKSNSACRAAGIDSNCSVDCPDCGPVGVFVALRETRGDGVEGTVDNGEVFYMEGKVRKPALSGL